jgi:hypothetical protein
MRTHANLIKFDVFVFSPSFAPYFFKVRILLDSDLFFPDFGTPWILYLSSEGVILKIRGCMSDSRDARSITLTEKKEPITWVSKKRKKPIYAAFENLERTPCNLPL